MDKNTSKETIEGVASLTKSKLEITGMGKNAQISDAVNCPILVFNVPKDIWEKDEEAFSKWLRANKANGEIAKSLGVTKIVAMDENAKIQNAINSPVVVFGTNEISFSVPEDCFNDVNRLKKHIKAAKGKEQTSTITITDNPEVSIQDSPLALERAHYSSPLSQPKSQTETGSRVSNINEEQHEVKKFVPHT